MKRNFCDLLQWLDTAGTHSEKPTHFLGAVDNVERKLPNSGARLPTCYNGEPSRSSSSEVFCNSAHLLWIIE